jgi:hypothetical protein
MMIIMINDGNKIVYMIWLERLNWEQGLDRNNIKIEHILFGAVNYSQWLQIVSNDNPLCEHASISCSYFVN